MQIPSAPAQDQPRSDYENILAEQIKCRDYLTQNGRHRGAELGLADWVGEEVFFLLEKRLENGGEK